MLSNRKLKLSPHFFAFPTHSQMVLIFNKNIQIEVKDEPLESMYLNASSQEISNKFKF